MDPARFLQQNASTISAVSNVGMLIVWLVYAHLLYQSHRRQRAPRPRITQVKGHSSESTCLVANLGYDTLYVERILVVVHTDDGVDMVDWTDRPATMEKTSRLSELTRQGPLAPGDCMIIGSFAECLAGLGGEQRPRLAPDGRANSSNEVVGRMDVRLVAFFGPEDQPIGAERRFRIQTASAPTAAAILIGDLRGVDRSAPSGHGGGRSSWLSLVALHTAKPCRTTSLPAA